MCRKSFIRNHFLVSTFSKWLLFGISQLFCLYCDKIFLICIWESIKFQPFLEKTSQQLPLYIIWFRVSPNRKYYFMSKTYLKPSQTSKMKLLAKVFNASRDVFSTVFSIQNVFRTSRMALFTKVMNGWKPLTFSAKSSILIFCWVLKMSLDSQTLTIFTKNWFLRGQICLCMYLVPQIWRWINEISKVGYEETQKNVLFLRTAVQKIS